MILCLSGGLSSDMIGKIVQEVTKQLGSLLGPDAVKGILGAVGGSVKDVAGAAADTAKDAAGGGILGKLKSLF